MKYLAIIPARGGSKGIPLKNIKLLNGKPLISYTIISAMKSKLLDRIVVSTDNEEIIQVCQEYSSIQILQRPPGLATDEMATECALLHVCEELEKKDGYIPHAVLTLEPTSPFRSVQTIENCINIFNTSAADSVLGVVETRSCYGKIIDGRYEYLYPNQPRRRQDRQPLYRESSTIYGTKMDILRRKKSVIGDNLVPLIIPKDEAIDINDLNDFEFAEFMMRKF